MIDQIIILLAVITGFILAKLNPQKKAIDRIMETKQAIKKVFSKSGVISPSKNPPRKELLRGFDNE